MHLEKFLGIRPLQQNRFFKLMQLCIEAKKEVVQALEKLQKSPENGASGNAYIVYITTPQTFVTKTSRKSL